MATVWIPSLMRDLTSGRQSVEVSGATVRQVINNLEAAYPGIRERVCDGDDLSPHVGVAVDGVIGGLGMLEPVGAASEVHFLPAVSGGEQASPAHLNAALQGRPFEPSLAGDGRGCAMARQYLRAARQQRQPPEREA